jgi:hypothetical protein
MMCCVDGYNFNNLIFYTQQDASYKVTKQYIPLSAINPPAVEPMANTFRLCNEHSKK